MAALDAALPFDYESRARRELVEKQRAEDLLKIGILGFGNFGQFLARRFVKQGHEVLATSRTDYSAEAASMSVRFFHDADDFVEEQPDVVVISTSILSMEKARPPPPDAPPPRPLRGGGRCSGAPSPQPPPDTATTPPP